MRANIENIAQKTNAPAKYVSELIVAKQMPMRLEPIRPQLAARLTAAIGLYLLAYTGTRNARKEMIEVCVDVIMLDYKHLNESEIKKAFQLGVTKTIDVDMTAYYGDFTAVAFGELMAAYEAYRKKVNYEIVQAAHAIEAENLLKSRASENEVKNKQAIKQCFDEIDTKLKYVADEIKKGKEAGVERSFDSYITLRNLPISWSGILGKAENVHLLGIDRAKKVELFKASETICKNIVDAESKSENVRERDSAISIINACFVGINAENKRIAVYGKLLVHFYLKQLFMAQLPTY